LILVVGHESLLFSNLDPRKHEFVADSAFHCNSEFEHLLHNGGVHFKNGFASIKVSLFHTTKVNLRELIDFAKWIIKVEPFSACKNLWNLFDTKELFLNEGLIHVFFGPIRLDDLHLFREEVDEILVVLGHFVDFAIQPLNRTLTIKIKSW